MIHTRPDKDRICQNLSDAGCSDEEIEMILKTIDQADYKKLDTLIEAHRNKLLEQYRHSRKCIDCIDYFTYELNRWRD